MLMRINTALLNLNFLKNLKFQYKLIVSYIILLTLPIISITLAVYYTFSQAIIGEMSQASIEALQQTIQNIDNNLKEIDRLYIPIITNERLKYIFEKKKENNNEVFTYNKEFIETIFPTIFGWRGDQINSVYFFGTNGINLVYRSGAIVYGDTSFMAIQLDKGMLEEDYIYKKAQEARGRGVWIPTHKDYFSYEKDSTMVVSFARKVLSLSEFKDWGLLIVNISENWLNDFYVNTQYGKPGYIFITDESGVIISHNNKDMLLNSMDSKITNMIVQNSEVSTVVKYEDENYLLNTATSSYTGWKIVSLVPMAELYKKIDIIKSTIIAILIACIVIAVTLSVIISRSITLPVKKLVKLMSQVEKGDLEARIKIDSNDEMGMLSRSFNKMIARVKELINTLTEKERTLRISELKALQAQINPHFLYNSLDSIYWMTKTGEYDNIAKMTMALARLFRLSLNKGNEKTTVQNEIEHVNNYLTIQKIRYKDKFDYFIDVDREIYGYETVKLVLQPLVENSLIHGLEYKEGIGHIYIFGKKEKENIIFEVIDDGAGIDVEKVEASLHEKRETSGYALKNVNERIKLLYGNEYGLKFYNLEKQGTKVEVRIPAILAEGDSNV